MSCYIIYKVNSVLRKNKTWRFLTVNKHSSTSWEGSLQEAVDCIENSNKMNYTFKILTDDISVTEPITEKKYYLMAKTGPFAHSSLVVCGDGEDLWMGNLIEAVEVLMSNSWLVKILKEIEVT